MMSPEAEVPIATALPCEDAPTDALLRDFRVAATALYTFTVEWRDWECNVARRCIAASKGVNVAAESTSFGLLLTPLAPVGALVGLVSFGTTALVSTAEQVVHPWRVRRLFNEAKKALLDKVDALEQAGIAVEPLWDFLVWEFEDVFKNCRDEGQKAAYFGSRSDKESWLGMLDPRCLFRTSINGSRARALLDVTLEGAEALSSPNATRYVSEPSRIFRTLSRFRPVGRAASVATSSLAGVGAAVSILDLGMTIVNEETPSSILILRELNAVFNSERNRLSQQRKAHGAETFPIIKDHDPVAKAG